MKLVVASNNAKKRHEIETILTGLDIELVPAEETVFVDVVEDADTFTGNARKKADAFAAANACAALADDSGLCVDALDGSPGIFSSRFAGEHATDADNNARLLRELDGIQDREAHFACALHLSFTDDHPPLTASGCVDGEIMHAASGHTGFGYDPLFFCPELGKAFADATAAEKASVSHRGRALRNLAQQLAT